jgi:hypothetical protein
MRCVCCNRNLSDYESTLRHAKTGEFLDTCRKCLADIPIPVKGRRDLNPTETMEDDDQTSFVKLEDIDE